MIDVLVTGGFGFIGSNIVSALVKQGKSVRVFDNSFRGDIGNLENIRKKIDLIKGDIRNEKDVQKAVKGVKTVFHLAYINGTEYFYKYPGLVLDVGVRGALNIIDAARESGVKTFVYASSSEIYQTPSKIPTPEDVSAVVPDPRNPRYSYGGGKILGELLTLHYARGPKMRRVIFRPHNIYGPRMGWEHVIPQLLKKIYVASKGFKKDKALIKIQGSGRETRSFCYVDDAVKGILICGQKGKDGEIYNVGKEEEVSIKELVNMIGRSLSIKIITRALPLMKGSTKRRCPDITKLKSLGYNARVSLQDGLERTVCWYKEKLLK